MQFRSLDLQTHEGIKFETIGRCIYCGVRGTNLSDEHIIPFALTHNSTIFEKASCADCQKIIQKFEANCLRYMLGAFRVRVGSPTRNKKDRPSEFRMCFRRFDDKGIMIDQDVMKDVPADQSPLWLNSWRLPTPGVLAGRVESDKIIGEAWCSVDQTVASRLLNQFRKETNHAGPAALKIGDIPQADFLRFLAKIAHGFAIANYGFDQFKHLAPDIILGRSKALCYVVGGEWEIPPPDTNAGIFDLKLGEAVRENTTYVVVGVRVYPFMGTPQHIVVVGCR